MYFEGKCTAEKLVPSIVQHITAATDESGNRLWEMDSSKVGTRDKNNSDNGWVFKSKGTSGEDNLVIGFANGLALTDQSFQWLFGGLMFVASDYQPGIPGTNGTFKGYMQESLPVFAEEWNSYTFDNLPMRYYLSVTKDRVICAYYTDVIHSHSRSNLIYLGKPAWSADPNDRGSVLASGLGYLYSSASYVRMTNPFSVITDEISSFTVRADLSDQARGWGGKLYPSRMVLVHSASGRGGRRGILDLLVVRQDGQFRKVDTVKIEGTEFLGIELPYTTSLRANHNNINNNFVPLNYQTGSLMYLFPKI